MNSFEPSRLGYTFKFMSGVKAVTACFLSRFHSAQSTEVLSELSIPPFPLRIPYSFSRGWLRDCSHADSRPNTRGNCVESKIDDMHTTRTNRSRGLVERVEREADIRLPGARAVDFIYSTTVLGTR